MGNTTNKLSMLLTRMSRTIFRKRLYDTALCHAIGVLAHQKIRVMHAMTQGIACDSYLVGWHTEWSTEYISVYCLAFLHPRQSCCYLNLMFYLSLIFARPCGIFVVCRILEKWKRYRNIHYALFTMTSRRLTRIYSLSQVCLICMSIVWGNSCYKFMSLYRALPYQITCI